MPEVVDICYLKATPACISRMFLVPKDDAWAYPVETSDKLDIKVVCGDCKRAGP